MTQQSRTLKRTYRWAATIGAVLLLALALVIGAVFYLAKTGTSAPNWVKTRLENQINANLSDGQVQLDGIFLSLSEGRRNPRLQIKGVTFFNGIGAKLAVLPVVSTELDLAEMIQARIRPINLRVEHAKLKLSRDTQGQMGAQFGDVTDLGSAANADPSIASGDVFSLLESVFEIPVLSHLEKIESLGTTIFLDDQLTGRSWVFSDGVFQIKNQPQKTAGTLRFSLLGDNDTQASATVSWDKPKNGDLSEISTQFSGVSSTDVADQVAALDWLRIVQAPISGSVTVKISDDGVFGDMNGVLDIGAGQIGPGDVETAVLFDGAKAYLKYDSLAEKLIFDEISVVTDVAEIKAQGQAFLPGASSRSIDTIVGQFGFTNVVLNPDGVFAIPLEIEVGALDVRIRLDPLVIDIGQLVLVTGGSKIKLNGSMSADDTGWSSQVDLSIDSVSRDQVVQMWPLVYKGKTRKWFEKNIHAGTIANVVGAFRSRPGSEPNMSVGFDVSDLTLKFMRSMPVIENGGGYGVMTLKDLNMVLEEGMVNAPKGGQINVAGTSIFIPDITVKQAPAEISLRTQSSVTAAMSLLDLKPFEFMSKAGVAVDLAKGTAKSQGTINLPLAEKVKLDQVDLNISAELNNVSTDKLIKNKTLKAKVLTLHADNSGVLISGDAVMGKTPLHGSWRQKFGPQHKGKSDVEASIELSQRFLSEFNIVFPDGAVSGKGISNIAIDLRQGKAPKFRLMSDMNRVRVAIDALGWSKPKNVTGRLEVIGVMAEPMQITKLSLSTKGLELEGDVRLKKDGALDVANLSRFDLGSWFSSPIEITKGSTGQLAFSLKGGEVDFRASNFGDQDGSDASNHINVNLDRLILSSGITLTDVKGDLATGNGVTGSFSARVNGGAKIVGTLAPQKNGIGVRFTSTDAGAVLRSSGVFTTAKEGRLDMVLLPSNKTGEYSGELNISDTRVVNASALAEILSLISVVGLIEKLSGEGIMFSDIDAKFRMTPDTIFLKEASAIGVSLGLTMEGNYSFDASSLDMQGVITPIYLLNGILEQSKVFGGLFGKKKGEGLFGFTYTMKGKVEDPEVGVNPLSILTPGLFRELFKRPIPTGDTDDAENAGKSNGSADSGNSDK